MTTSIKRDIVTLCQLFGHKVDLNFTNQRVCEVKGRSHKMDKDMLLERLTSLLAVTVI